MTIFIGNLSWDAEREDLIHLFTQYGEVSKCSMPLDRETGRKRGFAFVDLANEADETSTIDDLQNVEWMGPASPCARLSRSADAVRSNGFMQHPPIGGFFLAGIR